MSSQIKRAFTLIELVFVIAVLGIVGAISSDLVLIVYKDYVTQRETSALQSKANYIFELIEKKMGNAIPESIVDGAHTDIKDLDRGNGATIIQWIGIDTESIQGVWNGTMNLPCYNGLANIEQSSDRNITVSQLDNNLSCIDIIEGNITGAIPLTGILGGVDYNRTVLYFPYANQEGNADTRFWQFPPTSLFPVTDISDTDIELYGNPPFIGERFSLSYSAYAVEFVNDTLVFHDNFRPWNPNNYDHTNDPNTRSNLISDDINSFEFWGESSGGAVRFKICLDKNTSVVDVHFCKEGTVGL